MTRNCYPELKLGGYTPTAYWDFCTAADTAGQGRGYTPVSWEHLTGADLDTSSTPACVTPAMYYARSSDLTSELSKQDASLFTSNAATWFVQFRTDGAEDGSTPDCVLQKASPGGPGNSNNGFVFGYTPTQAYLHLKPGSAEPVGITVTISGGTTDKAITAAFSFNSSTFRLSANGSHSAETTTPGGGAFIVAATNPLVLGHYWDYYWGSLKGWVMRVATWQDYVASASEMDVLTAAFADPCYAPLAMFNNAKPLIFSGGLA
jgi:hypothetical protein